jgi:hypothetical protein
VQADGGHFKLAFQRPAVQRLDVLELVLEGQAAGVDLVVGQGLEHEGVVGVGAVADADQLLGHESPQYKREASPVALTPGGSTQRA